MSARLGIIGGYLGSGKTTLINALLAAGTLGRTAVLVNDFGEISIDASLVASQTEDTVELTNGCICCQITDDLSRVMRAFSDRDDVDQVLVEVSGVGDPTVLGAWRRFPGFSPGPIIVCADATNLRRLLSDRFVSDLVERQIGGADIVLVTKSDRASAADIAWTRQASLRLAPNAEILDDIPPDFPVRLRGTEDRPMAGTVPRSSASAPDAGGIHSSRTVDGLDAVDPAEILAILSHNRALLARAKGFIRDTHGCWHEVHLASGHAESRPLPRSCAPPDMALGTIVLIAAGDDAQRTVDTVASALAAVR
ncbi:MULTISPECIES: GTP-binding protein [unclassified Brevibacterium]|uniref:CobW family GTP-binding protein n=1 Tax=unclassified Brevibacterium TaxID=2614124 RepID=UPI0010F99364|nr:MULTISPECIES: GTP-binding protein [unclassified Brevibacterium]MCM1013978.1 GTP-binding protein [Brevibacterium sp. XM4083]